MSHLDELNDQQRIAATHQNGPLLVVAGAGTGKTKTIVHRILNLIKNGIDPQSILAITFTNKAASEMRQRVYSLLPRVDGLPVLSTFHSLGVRILRDHANVFGLNKYFSILDGADSLSLIKQAMKDLDIDPKMWEPRKISSIISRSKGDSITPETFSTSTSPISAITQSVWSRYEVLKKESKALDFADLLSFTYKLLLDNPEIRKYYQNKWGYVHVDEYQDTNTIQYNIVRLLVEKHNNLCAVGDGDQNIYSWRGADVKNILNFEKEFPKAKIVVLEKNYRSTGNILQASHEVISKNTQRIEKKLLPNKAQGEKVQLFSAFSANQEAEWIAEQTNKFIKQGCSPNEIAVLFRTNFQSRIIEESFLKMMIPYQVVGVKFFARKEIKDIMSYLRSALNPSSLPDIKRVMNEPKRGLGKVAMANIFANQIDSLSPKAKIAYEKFLDMLSKIAHHANSNLPSETIKFIINETGFQDLLSTGSADDQERLENMKELVTYAKKYDNVEQPLDIFLSEVALLSDQDSLDNNEEHNATVKLMTIHAAKGLEFTHVFVSGLEQGLFPSIRDDQKNKHEQEEERRLCYVAFTRAKEQLHLSYAQIRTIYGQQRINDVSEFVKDIPDDLITKDQAEETETHYLDF